MKGLIVVAGRDDRLRRLFLVLLFCLTGAIRTNAQVVGGTILGTITDKSGAIVPQASILVRNQANGVTRTVKLALLKRKRQEEYLPRCRSGRPMF
jgi:hypothetical protein